MKHVLILLGIAFVAILAVVVGQRLSTEAMAVVVGVVCGVAASVPVSLGLLLALGRLPALRSSAQPLEPARRDSPPVVVVTPGAVQSMWPGPGYAGPAFQSRPPGQERTFRIIGEEDESRLLHD